MTHEPDRPRRDVSIEEAERMPMTDEELAGIEERYAHEDGRAPCDDCAMMDHILPLVAEVRRLRVLLNMQAGTGPLGAFRDDSGPRMR